MVSEAVSACTGCLPGVLYSHLFGSDDDQHMVAVMQIRHRRDMQGILVGLAQAFSSGGQHSPEVIAGANEGGGEDRTRVAVNLFGMVELLNLALGHDCYAVGDGKSFFLVVSDIDGGHLELLLASGELVWIAAALVAQPDEFE